MVHGKPFATTAGLAASRRAKISISRWCHPVLAGYSAVTLAYGELKASILGAPRDFTFMPVVRATFKWFPQLLAFAHSNVVRPAKRLGMNLFFAIFNFAKSRKILA